MNPKTTSLALATALLCAAASASAQTTLAAPNERISDQAIQRDHGAYEAMQGRIKGLNDRGRPVRDYHLAKAQCWLDVSFHEYTRNDRGPFPQAALTESEKLVKGMEEGAKNLSMDTPLVGEAVQLRPDLWALTQGLKQHSGFACAQQKIACAEVELVHAGNEHAQQQWRHAKPYVQIAEDLLGEAKALAESCAPVSVATAVVAAPAPAPVIVAKPELGASVVFSFDRHMKGDIRPYSVAQLDELVRRIKADKFDVASIRLVGHADRLNSTGKADYNQKLSERRVQTVREELISRGIDPKLITTEARGDTQQVEGCKDVRGSARTASQANLQECLLPNRRVEVRVTVR